MILFNRSGPVELSTDVISALKLRWRTRDVDAELLKMHLYLTRYPKRRPAMIWRFVDNWLRKADAFVRPQTIVAAWWATDERTINQGAALGLSPRPGESMAQFRDRINAKLTEGRAA
jgi:hypothetical protein